QGGGVHRGGHAARARSHVVVVKQVVRPLVADLPLPVPAVVGQSRRTAEGRKGRGHGREGECSAYEGELRHGWQAPSSKSKVRGRRGGCRCLGSGCWGMWQPRVASTGGKLVGWVGRARFVLFSLGVRTRANLLCRGRNRARGVVP